MGAVGGDDHIAPLRDALTCRASPLKKQSTGLFFDSPLAERFVTVGLCPRLTAPAPLSLCDISPHCGESPHQRRCLWTPPKEHSPFGIPFMGSAYLSRCKRCTNIISYIIKRVYERQRGKRSSWLSSKF